MSVLQVPRCDFVFISQPGAVVPGLFFIIIVIIFRGRDGCSVRYAVGVLFLLFHNVALLLCDKGHRSFFEAIAGDARHSEGPGQGLMSAFYILGAEPQAYLHMVFHGLPLTHMLAHQ